MAAHDKDHTLDNNESRLFLSQEQTNSCQICPIRLRPFISAKVLYVGGKNIAKKNGITQGVSILHLRGERGEGRGWGEGRGEGLGKVLIPVFLLQRVPSSF